MHLAQLGWIVAALLALVALVQTARLARRRSAARRRLEWIRERGRAGEHAATALIERAGYRIDAQQPELEWTILCDGQPHSVPLRADLLVSRAGRSFIAEVKTGTASRLESSATRRQLLEYSIAYAVDGVLLVDMEERRIREVSFPRELPSRSGLVPMLIVAAMMVAAAWLALHLS